MYEQADSLGRRREGAQPQGRDVTPFITRAQAQALGKGNAKFVQALFAPESIQGKRNTEAIEIGPNTLIAARIVEYKPAAPRPFDEVKDEIRRQLTRKAASELAQNAGRAKTRAAERRQGRQGAGRDVRQAGYGWRATRLRPGFPPDALTKIFQASQDKLPAYIGATNERGDFRSTG